MTITILDGGMGQELIHRSGTPPTPLWSTQVMIDMPHLVREIHADYFAAGAEIATTNTYAIHRDRLAGTEHEDRFEDLHRIALDMALAARDAHGFGRVAGSIGPLGASYRADLQPAHEVAVELMAEVAGILAPACDLLLFETVISAAQTRAALEAVQGLGKPIWIAFSVDDEDGRLLRSGEPLTEAVALCGDAAALLANCSAPEAMPAAIDVLKASGKPVGAYANAFTQITKEFLADKPTVDALSARRDMGPEAYADQAATWVDHGATILGGCCETTPAHIAELARRFAGA
ncbi:homocysteine S-methyltransferase family protein [Marivita geojedonensis]|uniref:Homocysteine methyltransferase n=1 Tax=Marivita geojedonensis TaxID=1123756 RepID=A0A1X4NLG5_9RHOB|nr:homocysteine S-methyltransferase family protein [Marivita geojedonensis]OSQ50991.1 homocysteine methyltransferase [Marivita geojedonensis]PRY80015.1 homocysteine S-methyltransferase [Marivita geojedonensis]